MYTINPNNAIFCNLNYYNMQLKLFFFFFFKPIIGPTYKHVKTKNN